MRTWWVLRSLGDGAFSREALTDGHELEAALTIPGDAAVDRIVGADAIVLLATKEQVAVLMQLLWDGETFRARAAALEAAGPLEQEGSP